MSSSQPSSPLPSQHHSSDLIAIAAMLNEAAQALLNFGKAPEDGPVEDFAEDEDLSCPIEDGYKRGEFHEEYRCFRLPHFIVRREYELLQQHKQDKFAHLVNRVYEDLYTTVLLMRHFDDGTDISGFELHLISENLSLPLGLLNTICSQLADFELIQKTTVPA
ncbi:hypothetical protein LJC46_09350 [Desulfovibrio sp. OttesenSCG-928-G15]|nr:hypothetical protein [Desulfovibrio sp. OttesenSCG-928-G15]